MRLQQLYGSGQFVSIGSPILIDQFAFRVKPDTGAFHIEMANLDLYMSTSPRFPNLNGGAALLMSTTFADNVGPDNTLVYHGPVSWVSPGCPVNGLTPCDFDLLVTLQTPFYYDPSQGRLLTDFFITGLNGLTAARRMQRISSMALDQSPASLACRETWWPRTFPMAGTSRSSGTPPCRSQRR